MTPANREGIISYFQQDPTLRDTWVRCIPLHAQPPFSAVAEGIITRLQAKEVLLSTDGRYRRPQDIVVMPKGFRTQREEPVIPPQQLPSVHYLADPYNFSGNRQAFTRLGVKPMSEQNILDGLTNMDQADVIRSQDDKWHTSVCWFLNNMPRPMRNTIDSSSIYTCCL